MSGRPVAFINSMVRCRRRLQMLGQYEASDKVKKFRHKNSKYRADDNKVSKKDIERIALLKTNKK